MPPSRTRSTTLNPEETPLTLAGATRSLALPLNALANGPGEDLLAHDFSTLIAIDTSDLTTTEIVTSTLTLGALEMWGGEIYLVATDYSIPQSVVFRLTPETDTPAILPLENGAIATFLPQTAASIETLNAEGNWETATTTTGASREGKTLTVTSEAPTGIFRLRTRPITMPRRTYIRLSSSWRDVLLRVQLVGARVVGRDGARPSTIPT